MSYEHYALILTQEHRERQMAEAAEHKLGISGRPVRGRRPMLRPVGRLFVRLGHAMGADGEPDQTTLQPSRSR